jgi:2-C-methyl-D-erythritol 2,4-cyclodiphosphate synthase
MSLRVGIGLDAHRRIEGKPLVLGGVTIASDYGLEAHSDGDVLCHAILDALFGAASLGDKGVHFPPSDPQYKNIRSTVLVERAVRLLLDRGFKVNNIDVSVVCEEPKIEPHVLNMKKELSAALGVGNDRISVKATTMEKLGFTGRGEGVAAMAVALLEATDLDR